MHSAAQCCHTSRTDRHLVLFMSEREPVSTTDVLGENLQRLLALVIYPAWMWRLNFKSIQQVWLINLQVPHLNGVKDRIKNGREIKLETCRLKTVNKDRGHKFEAAIKLETRRVLIKFSNYIDRGSFRVKHSLEYAHNPHEAGVCLISIFIDDCWSLKPLSIKARIKLDLKNTTFSCFARNLRRSWVRQLYEQSFGIIDLYPELNYISLVKLVFLYIVLQFILFYIIELQFKNKYRDAMP